MSLPEEGGHIGPRPVPLITPEEHAEFCSYDWRRVAGATLLYMTTFIPLLYLAVFPQTRTWRGVAFLLPAGLVGGAFAAVVFVGMFYVQRPVMRWWGRRAYEGTDAMYRTAPPNDLNATHRLPCMHWGFRQITGMLYLSSGDAAFVPFPACCSWRVHRVHGPLIEVSVTRTGRLLYAVLPRVPDRFVVLTSPTETLKLVVANPDEVAARIRAVLH